MSDINWSEVRHALSSRASSIIEKYLPGGKWRRRNAYSCGDITGGKGQSFSIEEKDKGWIFYDFATGEQGDLIDILIHHEGDLRGREIACELVGVTMEKTKSKTYKPSKHKKPTKDWVNGLAPSIYNYMAERGLCDIVLLSSLPIAKKKPYMVYKHYEADGTLRMVVYKDVTRKNHPYCSKDSKQILWGMDVHLECPQLTEGEVIITEGHEDAIAWMHAGCNAVSVPMGANNLAWIENCWDWLQTKSRIYLCFDNDDPGIELTEKVIARMGMGKTWLINLSGHKDSNDLYLHDGSIGLAKALSTAKECKPESAVSAYDLIDDIVERWDKKREDVGIQLMGDPRYGFRLRERESTMITGAEGHGKSNFIYQAAAHLISEGHATCIFSLEEDAAVVTSLVYAHCMAKPCIKENADHFYHVRDVTKDLLFTYNHRGILSVDKMYDAIDYYIGKHGVKIVILDSLMMTSMNIEDNKEVNEFTGKLHEVIGRTNAHFLVVAHARKGDYDDIRRIPTNHDIKGAQSISGMAFNIFTIWRNKPKIASAMDALKKGEKDRYHKIMNTWPDNIFKMGKQKVGGKLRMVDLWYNHDNYRFRVGVDAMEEPYIVMPNKQEIQEYEKPVN